MDWIKTILGFALFAGFLALEWAVASSGIAGFSWLPLASLAVLWRIGGLPFGFRMAYGALAGFFLDALFVRRFGASIALFLLMAGVMEALHAVLSRRDSRAARAVHGALILILFFILLPVAESVISYV